VYTIDKVFNVAAKTTNWPKYILTFNLIGKLGYEVESNVANYIGYGSNTCKIPRHSLEPLGMV